MNDFYSKNNYQALQEIVITHLNLTGFENLLGLGTVI
jgi:hypothetical protein